MKLFQVLVLPFIAVMFAVSVRSLIRARARPLASILWLVLWAAAAVAVAEPDSTTQVALVLGIRRGADLLVYCMVLGFMVGFYLVYLKIRQLTREVTLLTRELAILGAERLAGDVRASTPRER